MEHSARLSRLAPWAGLMAGPLAWILHQQGLANMLHFDCHLGDASKGLLAGVAAALTLAACGTISWRTRGNEEPTRFIGTLGAMSAAMFLFAIALQTLATLILPGCGP
jgi:hypothetical protein